MSLKVPRWPAVLVGVLIVVGTIGAAHGLSSAERGWTALTALVAAVAAVAALRWPRTAVLATGVAVGAYFVGGLVQGPVFLALPLAVGLAALSVRPTALSPFIGGGLGLVAAGLVAGHVRVEPDEVLFWPIAGSVAVTVGGAGLGWWYAGRVEVREQQAQRAASEERLRMTRELHDGVGHGLAVIAMQAGVALHVVDQDPAQVRRSLRAIRDTSRESLDALRAELARMSGEPGARRPAPGLADLEALLDRVRAGGLSIELHGRPDGVPEATGQAAYAVVQESLTNVLRHAVASRAIVSLERQDGRLSVSVADDGRGAAGQTGPMHGEGLGLESMRSRVEALGGTFSAGPSGDGYRVRAEIPW